MAAAKKSSKKKSSKSKRTNACARGGSEMRTIKGTSPRSVRRRSKAAFDLVTCRKARPVKAKKRAPKKRASVKNGSSKYVVSWIEGGRRKYLSARGETSSLASAKPYARSTAERHARFMADENFGMVHNVRVQPV